MSARLHVITLALVIVAACSGRRRTPDDTIVVAIETPMTTPDPRHDINKIDEKLTRLVCAGLTALDSPDMVPRLELAASVDRVDDLTWDVAIKDNAKFSDGSAVTADDVARTFRELIDPESTSEFHKAWTERLESIEVTSARTVRFHLKTPLATIFTDLDFGILSYHGVSPGESAPHVVCAGPYVLRELTSQAALLDANPYYLNGPPKLPHVEIKFVRDANARILMLAGGSVDLVQNGVRPDLVDDVAADPGLRIEAGRSVILTYMLINNDDPLLADVRVRQALALAIDRKSIIAARFAGRAVPAIGLLPPTHWAFEPEVARYDFDPVRAGLLLDAAGHPRGPDGVRFHLVYKTSSDDFRVAVAHVIAAQLAKVGIDVEIRPFEFATFFADIKRGNYQIATMQTADITEPDFYYTYFHSTWIPSKANPDGYNRWRYRNARVDELTVAGRRELDRAKRKVIYAEVQRIVAGDVPIVPLWHEDNVAITGADLQGYTIVPNARLTGLIGVTKHR
jgi:peptide/nickel transport system substrate-binding protein